MNNVCLGADNYPFNYLLSIIHYTFFIKNGTRL